MSPSQFLSRPAGDVAFDLTVMFTSLEAEAEQADEVQRQQFLRGGHGERR